MIVNEGDLGVSVCVCCLVYRKWGSCLLGWAMLLFFPSVVNEVGSLFLSFLI